MVIMGSSSPNRPLIYDEVRRRYVSATPEERVRQRWLQWMIHELHYPKELLTVEKKLKELPHLFGKAVPQRRVDILCYGKGIHPCHLLYPMLMIECKDGELTDAAIDQVIGYNHHVGAYFVAVANLEEVRVLNVQGKHYPVLPSFMELMKWVKP
jgi:hypothetical protein